VTALQKLDDFFKTVQHLNESIRFLIENVSRRLIFQGDLVYIRSHNLTGISSDKFLVQRVDV
jgi:hypothetical protein